jgi:membrane peptidoglycan carboxypeptidase
LSSAARPVPAGPPRRSRISPTNVGWLAIIAFFFLTGLGLIGAVATVGGYVYLASGLKDPTTLTQIPLPEQSIVYDRTGKVELARFGENQREVVGFDQIPPVLLDATTAVEDKTFWENAGFDPVAIISAAVDSLRGNSRGASTITQQLVRNRLLETDLVQDPHRTLERKLKEIIQSIRVTQAFPGEEGKQQIITAYLNQNYYGNQSYGVKAAVESYFGIPLEEVTPAQAAIIAGLPKSPSNYDLVRNKIERCTTVVAEGADCPKSELVVPNDTKIVERRNTILGLLADGRTPMSGATYTSSQFLAARNDDVLLASQVVPRWTAPHHLGGPR